MSRILVVDDDEALRQVLKMRLEAEDYQVTAVEMPRDAVAVMRENTFDLALVDLMLKNQDGLRLMEDIHAIRPETPIIILTGHGSIESAVTAMKRGAQGYLTKPFDHRELLLQISKCIEKRDLLEEVTRLRQLVKERYGFDNIVGKSEKMERVLEQVSLAAGSDSVVHIEGESGTGKELIARALHVASQRRDGPFIAVNCAAIPENLIESELFGYERGAFTGAVKTRDGFFKRAHGGSLFLDEITEMPLAMQPKLLRVLEEKRVYPIGGSKTVEVDVRIITASNRNLKGEVKKGAFREDLFYRIHVIPIRLPPLRERKEEIPFLVRHFLAEFSRKMGKEVRRVSPGAMQRLMAYDWPGNVRELKNAVEYAVAMSTGDVVTRNLLMHVEEDLSEPFPTFKEAKRQCEREYLLRLIRRTGGNISVAARLAGKYRADLYTLFRRYGIEPDDYRDTGS